MVACTAAWVCGLDGGCGRSVHRAQTAAARQGLLASAGRRHRWAAWEHHTSTAKVVHVCLMVCPPRATRRQAARLLAKSVETHRRCPLPLGQLP